MNRHGRLAWLAPADLDGEQERLYTTIARGAAPFGSIAPLEKFSGAEFG